MKKVVELYKGILPAIGLTSNAAGQIFVGGGELGEVKDLNIDDKSVFLALEEHLKSPESKNSILFHPLAEDFLKKRSHMLTEIQKSLSTRLYTAGVTLITALLSACVKQRKGEEITDPKLLKLISGNEECDDKTLSFFNKIVSSDNGIFTVYLRHGNEAVDGSTRQCSITSLLLTELERVAATSSRKSGALKIWGVESPRKKDVLLLANAIKSIFPGLENSLYTYGSKHPIAPYCDSLFESTLAINKDIISSAIALNSIEPVSSLIEYLCIDVSALETILSSKEDYDILRNGISRTAYNDGNGWLTDTKTLVAREAKSSTARSEGSPTRAPEPRSEDIPDPVEKAKEIIVNKIKPIPGSRQPIATGITEDDYRTKQSRPSRSDRNGGYGYSDTRSGGLVTVRDIEDEIAVLERELDDASRHRDHAAVREITRELTKLDLALEDMTRGRDSRRGGYSSRGRGRGYDSPRGYDQDRGYDDSRRGRRDEPRRGHGGYSSSRPDTLDRGHEPRLGGYRSGGGRDHGLDRGYRRGYR